MAENIPRSMELLPNGSNRRHELNVIGREDELQFSLSFRHYYNLFSALRVHLLACKDILYAFPAHTFWTQ